MLRRGSQSGSHRIPQRKFICFAFLAVVVLYNLGREFELVQNGWDLFSDKPTNAEQRVREVDCRTFRTEFDPNLDLGEDPKRLVDLSENDDKSPTATPPFWIALHRRDFDGVRWKSIMEKGEHYETGITRIVQEILGPSEPKGLVIDVGMNVGWFSLLSRAMGHRVFGFDANPIMHSRVCNSLAYNGWWDKPPEKKTRSRWWWSSSSSSSSSSLSSSKPEATNKNNERKKSSNTNSSTASGVATFLYGLGDAVEWSVRFKMDQNAGFVSHVAPNDYIGANSWMVNVTTLDIVASERGWLPPPPPPNTTTTTTTPPAKKKAKAPASPPVIHLLKLHTDGREPGIIRGAAGLLRSGWIRNILHETGHSAASSAEIGAMFASLSDAGYVVHAITSTRGSVPGVFRTLVGPVNLLLRNKTFEGSGLNEELAGIFSSVWWKRLGGDKSGDNGGGTSSDDLLAGWRDLEAEHAANNPKGDDLRSLLRLARIYEPN